MLALQTSHVFLSLKSNDMLLKSHWVPAPAFVQELVEMSSLVSAWRASFSLSLLLGPLYFYLVCNKYDSSQFLYSLLTNSVNT